jgi:transcriptional regulator with XRE-family HTH domain
MCASTDAENDDIDTDEIDYSIESQIRTAMEFRRIETPAQLADASGVSVTSIRKQLKGLRHMKKTTLNKIALALGCEWHEEWSPAGEWVMILKVKKPSMRGN